MARNRIPEAEYDKCFALMKAGVSRLEACKRLGLDESTVRSKEKRMTPEQIQERRNKEEIFAAAFIDDCQQIISDAVKLLNGEVRRRVDLMKEKAGNKEEIIVKDLRELATVVGIVYDKQALAAGKATSNVEVAIDDKQRLMLEVALRRLNAKNVTEPEIEDTQA